MQVFSSGRRWTFPEGTLGALTREAHERAAAVSGTLAELRDRTADVAPSLPFGATLRGDRLRVIAEVKRASPSKGAIAPGLDAADQARAYVAGGAAAVSVLTEPTRFGGTLGDLAAVAGAVAVPVIRKDFLVHPVQLWEARAAGASAGLLIMRSLCDDDLARLMHTAADAGLATLVEVRDLGELDRALAAGATVIGVNNRNLETLVIDPATAPAIIPCIPAACIAVAESGMRTPDDLIAAASAGADAVLVGSAISAAADPEGEVRQLAAVPRRIPPRDADRARRAGPGSEPGHP